jgi:glycosyltransferase involved in cell wall biosynthesis
MSRLNKPIVAIIMATYNGEKYLKEQLDSILNQRDVIVHLYISDDGSTDNTLNIIQDYKDKYQKNFKNVFKVNFNHPANNFLSILPKITDQYEFYAFSDQDDVWYEDKLITAISKIKEGNDLYCGRTENVNKNLISIGYSPLFEFAPCFKNAIVQSIAGSNTMLFNQKIFNLLKTSFNLDVHAHDWWTYILATFSGHQVYYDPFPKIMYRQHENNFNGSNLGLFNQLRRIIMGLFGRFKYWNNLNEKNLMEFLDFATRENLKIFYKFQYLRKKYTFMNFNPTYINRVGVYRQTTLGNWMLKLSILLNRA